MRVRLDSGAVVVGRNVFPAAIKVSARHAVFRKVGPETWLQSFGRNGTYRWNGSSWIRLPDGKPILVQKGDMLRFADLELLVS
jgi:pSer/pThr/pTyr-binding forkhead associated (FHA) protein